MNFGMKAERREKKHKEERRSIKLNKDNKIGGR